MSTPGTEPLDPDPTRVDDAPPWSIPIREPEGADPGERRSGIARTLVFAVLAVAVFSLTVWAGAGLLDGDDGGRAAGPDADQVSPAGTDEGSGIDPDAIAPETTSTTAAPTTSTTAAPTTTETSVAAPTTTAAPATTAAPPTTRPSAPSGTGAVPALPTSFRGWIAQLTTVPYTAGSDGLEEEWRRQRSSAPGAVAARSDDWDDLRDGFWVLVEPGPFESADDVRSFCASAGFDGADECLPRELRG